jgi:hypothetical protein
VVEYLPSKQAQGPLFSVEKKKKKGEEEREGRKRKRKSILTFIITI